MAMLSYQKDQADMLNLTNNGGARAFQRMMMGDSQSQQSLIMESQRSSQNDQKKASPRPKRKRLTKGEDGKREDNDNSRHSYTLANSINFDESNKRTSSQPKTKEKTALNRIGDHEDNTFGTESV